MTAEQALIDLEHDGWKALSSGPDDARTFYDKVLSDDVLMLLPGGVVIDDRDEALRSMQGAPWTSFALSDERVLQLDAGAAVVAYRARATRDETSYEALVNSTYVSRDGRWRLVVHQQTQV